MSGGTAELFKQCLVDVTIVTCSVVCAIDDSWGACPAPDIHLTSMYIIAHDVAQSHTRW